MLQGVICDYFSQLCTVSKQVSMSLNSAQSLLTISNNVVLWMIISGLFISLFAGMAFSSLIKKEMISGYGGIIIIVTCVGMVVLQTSELAYLVIVKFISMGFMAVVTEDDIDTIVKMGILAGIGFLLLILHTRYYNIAFPAVVTDVAVAAGGLVLMRTVKYLPSLIPFIVLGIILIVLRNHGMGADVLTEFGEKLLGVAGIMP